MVERLVSMVEESLEALYSLCMHGLLYTGSEV